MAVRVGRWFGVSGQSLVLRRLDEWIAKCAAIPWGLGFLGSFGV